MKTRPVLVTLILIMLACAALSFQAAKPVTYEYKFETNITEARANFLAADGWQLITIGGGGGDTSATFTFVFSRQKR